MSVFFVHPLELILEQLFLVPTVWAVATIRDTLEVQGVCVLEGHCSDSLLCFH